MYLPHFVRISVISYHNITADYFPQAKIVVYLFLSNKTLSVSAHALPPLPKGEVLA